MIKIWVDDERPMPEGYDYWFKSVWETLLNFPIIVGHTNVFPNPDDRRKILLDIDHDSGTRQAEGGDFINILKALSLPTAKEGARLVWNGDSFKVHFHSSNPVGVKNMRAIVEKCPWMEEV